MMRWLCGGLVLLPLVALQPQTNLTECLESGLRNHPAVALMRDQVKLSRAELQESTASLLPGIDFTASYRRQSDVPHLSFSKFALPGGMPTLPDGITLGSYDTYDFRLTVTQSLFSGFRLRRRREAALLNLRAKELELIQAENDLALQIITAYTQSLKADRTLQIARKSRDQIIEHLQWVEKLLAQGMAKKEELLKTKVMLSEADLKVLQAENGRRLARTSLESLCGFPPADSLAPLPETAPPPTELENCLSEALQNRAEVKQLAVMETIGEIGVEIAKGGRLPNAAAFASYGYGKPGLDFIRREWMDYWLIGVGAEWNLWSWGKTRAQVQQAVLRRNGFADIFRRVQQRITLEVTEAFLRRQEAHRTRTLTAVMVEQAEESRRVAEAGYRQGRVLHLEAFDALLQWEQAQLLHAQAEIDASLADYRLLHALGRPPADELKKLSN